MNPTQTASVKIQPHTTAKPFIEFKNVTKQYGDIFALRKINLRIHGGEFISLVGPSGAGKSTLVRLLIREELPSHGQILIAGRDITLLRQRQLPYYRRKVGVVFQDFKLLLHKTVAENVSFALEVCEVPDDEIARRVPKILELVGLGARADNYPNELSGGEKQRVTIARALVHGPKILIADEPTGNLDPQNAAEIIELFQTIHAKGTTVLLATHNKNIVDRLRRRVVLMRAGEIVSDQAVAKYML